MRNEHRQNESKEMLGMEVRGLCVDNDCIGAQRLKLREAGSSCDDRNNEHTVHVPTHWTRPIDYM